jgi:UDP-N-acetylenolpyruvoylglucosamine reductase
LNRQFKRRCTNGQEIHEKMCNTLSHQGNANKNDIEILSQQMLARMWGGREPWYVVDGIIN